MKTITIELPDNLALPGSVTSSDHDLAREVRLAVAIEWYRQGRISQRQGAEIAGLSRAAFLKKDGHRISAKSGADTGFPGDDHASDTGRSAREE